jgi:hypothetical protein
MRLLIEQVIEELFAGLVELLGSLAVGDRASLLIECCEGQAGFEEGFGLR